MATLKKAVLVALAAVVGLMPVFVQVSYAQELQVQETLATLPDGAELSDEELIDVEGELDPLTIAAAAIVGAVGGGVSDLFIQGVQIAMGQRESIDWREVGLATGAGAVIGAVSSPLVPVVRSALVTGARWMAQAARATGAAAVSLGTRFYGFLCRAHEALHRYVTEPVVGFFERLIKKR